MARRMPNELPDEAKDFAVTCFAKFMTPTQVAEAVNARFGTAARPTLLDRRTAQRYDPTTAVGRALGKARKKLYEEMRKRVLDELEQIPIASKSVRLHQLQLHYDDAIERKNVGMGLRILEQAAKEAGGVHSNEHTVRHTGAVAIKEEVTEDEMRNSLSAAIAYELDKMRERPEPAAPTRH